MPGVRRQIGLWLIGVRPIRFGTIRRRRRPSPPVATAWRSLPSRQGTFRSLRRRTSRDLGRRKSRVPHLPAHRGPRDISACVLRNLPGKIGLHRRATSRFDRPSGQTLVGNFTAAEDVPREIRRGADRRRTFGPPVNPGHLPIAGLRSILLVRDLGDRFPIFAIRRQFFLGDSLARSTRQVNVIMIGEDQVAVDTVESGDQAQLLLLVADFVDRDPKIVDVSQVRFRVVIRKILRQEFIDPKRFGLLGIVHRGIEDVDRQIAFDPKRRGLLLVVDELQSPAESPDRLAVGDRLVSRLPECDDRRGTFLLHALKGNIQFRGTRELH